MWRHHCILDAVVYSRNMSWHMRYHWKAQSLLFHLLVFLPLSIFELQALEHTYWFAVCHSTGALNEGVVESTHTGMSDINGKRKVCAFKLHWNRNAICWSDRVIGNKQNLGPYIQFAVVSLRNAWSGHTIHHWKALILYFQTSQKTITVPKIFTWEGRACRYTTPGVHADPNPKTIWEIQPGYLD